MSRIVLDKGEVERLQCVVQDLADFPDTVTGYLVMYHTLDDRLRALYLGNPSELIGDVHCVLHGLTEQAFLAKHVMDGDDGGTG
jgi:hypothetical protein